MASKQSKRTKTGLTPEKWRPKFLAALAKTCNVTASARAAGVERQTAYAHRAQDADFAEQWEDALQQGIDHLETEAHRRAFEGVEEPVGWHQGVAGGTVRRYSDVLAIFLLKAHRPEKYRERHEISGPNGGPVEVAAIGPEEAAKRQAEILQRASLQPVGAVSANGNGKPKNGSNGNGRGSHGRAP